MIKTSFHRSISINELSASELETVKKALTRYSRDYMTGDMIATAYYYIDGDTLQVPRFFPLRPGIPDMDTSEAGKELPDNVKLSPGISYRAGQEQSILEGMSENVLTLMKPPGSGKTVIGSSVIINRHVRSMIVVDQKNLQDQWCKALDMVGTNVDYTVKMDFENPEEYDVYIVTIQALLASIRKLGIPAARNVYESLHIGNVILDEVHCLIGPDKFSEVCHIVNSRYVLALSATPKDDIYVKYWLGNTVKGDRNYSVSPRIFDMVYNTRAIKSRKYIEFGGKFMRDRYAKSIFTKSDSLYTDVICSMAYKSYLMGRHVLVIMNYNESGVDIVHARLEAMLGGDKVARYVSGCDKDIEEKKPVIVSNYKMLQKGTDIPSLDTLIMAEPPANATGLEQTIGRILRVNKGVKKKQLLVMDITDYAYGGPMLRWREIRKRFYDEKNFEHIKK